MIHRFIPRTRKLLACCQIVSCLSTGLVSREAAMLMSPRVLSIQSTVSHGYVGNKAAVFPLQCMGFNVDNINTVSLSNHPNYSGGFKGQFLAQEEMRSIVEGLQSNDLMQYDVVMNGYTRSIGLLEEIATTVKAIQEVNPEAIYICDPVLGDNDAYYVPETLLEVYKDKLLPLAFAVTPNYFEVEALTGIKVRSFEDAERACNILHDFGVKVCVLTGQRLSGESGPQSILFSVKIDNTTPFILRSDVKALPGYFYGCGDLFCALTTSGLYRALSNYNTAEQRGEGGKERKKKDLIRLMAEVLELSTWAMDSVLQETHRLGMKELRIVESIEVYRLLTRHWKAISSDKGIKEMDIGQDSRILQTTFAPPPSIEGTSSAPATRSYLASAEPDAVVAVIVDMDGTLTEAGAIDFVAMYERNGFKRGSGDILEMIEHMPDEESRKRAMDIVVEEEVKGCDAMVLRPDLYDFVKKLKNSRIRLALSTRNSGPALEHFLHKAGFGDDTFVPALHRDSLGKVNKPDPAVAFHVMKEWGISIGEGQKPPERQVVWFLGDSIDDVACGKAAGCKTCLIRTPFNGKVQQRDDLVDLVVNSLSEWVEYVGL